MTWNSEGGYYTGTSNVVLPVPNKQFYPAEFQNRSRLAYYAHLFNSVEINSTFYKLPQPATVAKWAAEVPDNFRFTFKLWKEITHNAGLNFEPAVVRQFMQVVNQAGNKAGCLLIQFPPSTSVNLPQLQNLLAEIRLSDADMPWPLAVEFRHRSWYQDEVYDLLDEYAATMVLHDLPASAAPMRTGEADLVYLRFHGPNGGYRGSYDDDILQEFAQYIREWMQDGKAVYAYFNNTLGDAVKNLQTLNSLLQAD